jgi:hypothetical protein
MKRGLQFFVLLWLLPVVGVACADDETSMAEIEFLLQSVGQSECSFIRNGKEHSPVAAESHLRLKYKKGKRWIDSAEAFIERLASESSWSGNTYLIRCKGREPQPSRDWFYVRLNEYRM